MGFIQLKQNKCPKEKCGILKKDINKFYYVLSDKKYAFDWIEFYKENKEDEEKMELFKDSVTSNNKYGGKVGFEEDNDLDIELLKICEKSDDLIAESCGGGMLVFLIRLLIIIWWFCLAFIVVYCMILLAILLLKASTISPSPSPSSDEIENKATLLFLQMLSNVLWTPCIYITGLFFCILAFFVVLYIIYLAVVIIRRFPIFCVCWEMGIFHVLKLVFDVTPIGIIIKAILEVQRGEEEIEENKKKTEKEEIYQEFIKTCKITSNGFDCSLKQFKKASKFLSSNVKSPISINTDFGEGKPKFEPKFAPDEKMQKIEYQNCLNESKKDSPVDSSTVYALNSLHEIKCYNKVMAIGINSYDDGKCVKQKSTIKKGIDSIGPVKEDLEKEIQKSKCTSNTICDSSNCSNILVCQTSNHPDCSVTRTCDSFQSKECSDISTITTSSDSNCTNTLIYSVPNTCNLDNSNIDSSNIETERENTELDKYIQCWLKKVKGAVLT